MTEEKKEKIIPKKLIPPPDICKRMVEKDISRQSNNKFINFFKVFLGEGF